jgi:hypothetical protein
MLTSNHVQAFGHTPLLNALCEVLLQMKRDCPDFVFVADTPFYVNPDGTLYPSSIKGARIVERWEAEGTFDLEDELVIIAHGLQKDQYNIDDVELLEEWCAGSLKSILMFYKHTKALN